MYVFDYFATVQVGSETKSKIPTERLESGYLRCGIESFQQRCLMTSLKIWLGWTCLYNTWVSGCSKVLKDSAFTSSKTINLSSPLYSSSFPKVQARKRAALAPSPQLMRDSCCKAALSEQGACCKMARDEYWISCMLSLSLSLSAPFLDNAHPTFDVIPCNKLGKFAGGFTVEVLLCFL